jgi:hypothetical protein
VQLSSAGHTSAVDYFETLEASSSAGDGQRQPLFIVLAPKGQKTMPRQVE